MYLSKKLHLYVLPLNFRSIVLLRKKLSLNIFVIFTADVTLFNLLIYFFNFVQRSKCDEKFREWIRQQFLEAQVAENTAWHNSYRTRLRIVSHLTLYFAQPILLRLSFKKLVLRPFQWQWKQCDQIGRNFATLAKFKKSMVIFED